MFPPRSRDRRYYCAKTERFLVHVRPCCDIEATARWRAERPPWCEVPAHWVSYAASVCCVILPGGGFIDCTSRPSCVRRHAQRRGLSSRYDYSGSVSYVGRHLWLSSAPFAFDAFAPWAGAPSRTVGLACCIVANRMCCSWRIALGLGLPQPFTSLPSLSAPGVQFGGSSLSVVYCCSSTALVLCVWCIVIVATSIRSFRIVVGARVGPLHGLPHRRWCPCCAWFRTLWSTAAARDCRASTVCFMWPDYSTRRGSQSGGYCGDP